MFSPMASTLSAVTSATVRSVPGYLQAFRASTSAGFSVATTEATSLTKPWNTSFLATKSVWELTSMITPTPLSAATAKDTPSAATLPAFLVWAARPFSRSHSMALSKSPSASTRAFLQSIMPTPVISRSFCTSFAAIAIINYLQIL